MSKKIGEEMENQEKLEEMKDVKVEKKDEKLDAEKVQEIVKKAKAKGKITYEELAKELENTNPDQIDKVCDEDLKRLETLIKTNQKIVGIGEIGLDYHYGTDKEKQKKLFKEQLKIAQRLNLPVVIHSRDATKDTIDILKMYNVSGVIHCFSGSLETANIYISMGYKLGIGGVLTFKNSKLYKVIENINLENIVLETDSPYLTPEPYRGKTNSSKYIPIIAKKLAEVKKVSIEEVAKITTNNAYLIFDLK